jgi:GR25 family glycosyltransferase involved in LPS biosynthesis
MKAYVITIRDLKESQEVADRCVTTGKAFGVDVEPWDAVTPTDPRFRSHAFNLSGFDGNRFSRLEPCIATFLSHASLWQHCADRGEPMVILEHDAVFRARLPGLSSVNGCCNLGRPSFGSFTIPPDGFGPLVSKPYLPGAHAYYLTPDGADRLLAKAPAEAEPTDVYLNIGRFPWLTEFYPWPVICKDSFTTIQNATGCAAKHNTVRLI